MLATLMAPESRDFLLTVLPIFWALVAALIALVLYKSSASFLEGLTIPGIPLKGLRLAGSVVIFVVAFLLLKYATAMEPRQGILVTQPEVNGLRESSERLQNATADLVACAAAASDDVGSCQVPLNQVRSEAIRLSQAIARMDAASQREQAAHPAPK